MAFPPGTKLLQEDGVTIIPKKIVMAQMRKLAKALRKQPALAFMAPKPEPCQTPCDVMDSSMPPATSSPESQNLLTPQLTSSNDPHSPKWGETCCNKPVDCLSPFSTSSSDDDAKKPSRRPLSHIIRAVKAASSTSLTSDTPASPEKEARMTTTPLPTLLAEPLRDVKPEKPAGIKLKPDEVFDHNGRPRKKMPHEMPFSPTKSENERPKPKTAKRKVPPPPKPKCPKAVLNKPDASHWGDFKIPKKQ
uniref:Uncharacterized protein n=1 Tax=Panagrellus redivivus TaxID=6233 RepID=A0A7E4ZVJ1_PANRE